MKKKIFDQRNKTVSQGYDDHKKFLSKPSSHFGEPTMYQQDSNPEGASALQNFTTQSSAPHPRKPFVMQVVKWCTDVRNIIPMRPEGSVVLKWVYVFFVLVHFTKSNNVLAKIMS